MNQVSFSFDVLRYLESELGIVHKVTIDYRKGLHKNVCEEWQKAQTEWCDSGAPAIAIVNFDKYLLNEKRRKKLERI